MLLLKNISLWNLFYYRYYNVVYVYLSLVKTEYTFIRYNSGGPTSIHVEFLKHIAHISPRRDSDR